MAKEQIDIKDLLLNYWERFVAGFCGFIVLIFLGIYFLQSPIDLSETSAKPGGDFKRILTPTAWRFWTTETESSPTPSLKGFTSLDFRDNTPPPVVKQEPTIVAPTNQAPIISNFSIEKGKIDPYQIIFFCKANDPDGEIVSRRIETGDGKTYSIDSNTMHKTHTYAKDGTYIVVAICQDNQGKETRMEKEVVIDTGEAERLATQITFTLKYQRYTNGPGAVVSITSLDHTKTQIVKVGENLYGFTLKNINRKEILLQSKKGKMITIGNGQQKALIGERSNK